MQYENRPQGRVHGEHPEGVRAEMHGGYPEGSRAVLHGGHREGVRADAHGGHREGFRAELHGGHREGVRADEHGEDREQGRAEMHGEHRDGDRAVGHGGDREDSRAALPAGAQRHGEVGQTSANPRLWEEVRTSAEVGKSESHGNRKREEEDTLKATTIVLPTLKPPVAGDAGLTCGDWLAQLRPLMGDLAIGGMT